MSENFPVNSFIQLVTAVAALGVVGILWKYRKAIAVRFLISLELCVAVWAISYSGEFVTGQEQGKILWSQLSYFGISFIPGYYFFFAIAFSQKKKLITNSNIFLSYIIPAVTILMVFTNKFHHLVWEEVTFSIEKNMLLYKYGAWFWVFYTYTFLLVGGGILILFSSVYKFTAFYRSQIVVLLLGSSLPVIANIIYVSKLNPFQGFDWTTLSFVLSGMLIAFGVYRYQIFELVPLANKKLLDTMGDAVIVVNEKGLIESVNPATHDIFEIDKKKALTHPIQKVFKEHQQIIEAFNKKEDNVLDIQIGQNGNTRYYQVKITSIINHNQTLSGKLIVANDVSSIRKTELKVKRVNKQLKHEIKKNEKLIEDLDSFAHTVAHDLKNTLGSIYSSSEVIIDSLEEDNKELVKEISLLIREMSDKTIQVTNEMLKMATAGHQDVEKVPVDMQAVFTQVQKQIQEYTEQYEATIIQQGDWHTALGYAPWLEEVWVNYLSNAIKYGGKPPQIIVGSEKLNKNMIKFWIRDNGDGIAPKDHDKLFKKHTRLNPEKAMGYGLGLSIVKRIVEKLNGTVGLESTGQAGKGSEFYFILPAR